LQQLTRCRPPLQALADGKTRRSRRVARRAGGGSLEASPPAAAAARRPSVGLPEARAAAGLLPAALPTQPAQEGRATVRVLPQEAAAPSEEAAAAFAAAAPAHDSASLGPQQQLQRRQQQAAASQRLTSRLLWEHDAAQRQQAGAAAAAAAAREAVAAAASPFLQPAAAAGPVQPALPPLPSPADLDAFLQTAAAPAVPSGAAAPPQPPAARAPATASAAAADQPPPPFGRLPRAQQLQQAERRLSSQPSFGSWLAGEPLARRSSDATFATAAPLLPTVAEEAAGSLGGGGGGGSAKGAPASVAPPSTIHADTWRSLIDLGITSPPSGEPLLGEGALDGWRRRPTARSQLAGRLPGAMQLLPPFSLLPLLSPSPASQHHSHPVPPPPHPPSPHPSTPPPKQATQPWWAPPSTSAPSPAAPSPPRPCSSLAPCSRGGAQGCAPAAACGGEGRRAGWPLGCLLWLPASMGCHTAAAFMQGSAAAARRLSQPALRRRLLIKLPVAS
jgi:hypothetical protein